MSGLLSPGNRSFKSLKGSPSSSPALVTFLNTNYAQLSGATFTGPIEVPEVKVTSLTPTHVVFVDSDTSLTGNNNLKFDGANKLTLGDGTGKYAAGLNNTFTATDLATNAGMVGQDNTINAGNTTSDDIFACGRANVITVTGANNANVAVGIANTTNGSQTYAIGQANNCQGDFASAIGGFNIVGDSSYAIGKSNTLTSGGGFAIGSSNIVNVGAVIGSNGSNGGSGALVVSSGTVFNTIANRTIIGSQLFGASYLSQAGFSIQNENPIGFHPTANTLITNVASLGAEKISNGTFTGSATGWTLGTGWAYATNRVNKNADGTGTLTQTSAAMVTPLVVGEYYYLTFNSLSFSVGTYTVSIGGVTFPTFNALGTQFSTHTVRLVFRATSTADLTFTPSSTSRFNIDTVTLKRITAGELQAGRLVGIGFIPPTIAAGAGAGTTPTVSVVGSDMGGEVNVTTGALPTAAAVVATITLGSAAFTNAPYVVLQPANAATALLTGATMVYVTATTGTFVINAGATGLVAATAYKWNYHIVGRA